MKKKKCLRWSRARNGKRKCISRAKKTKRRSTTSVKAKVAACRAKCGPVSRELNQRFPGNADHAHAFKADCEEWCVLKKGKYKPGKGLL